MSFPDRLHGGRLLSPRKTFSGNVLGGVSGWEREAESVAGARARFLSFWGFGFRCEVKNQAKPRQNQGEAKRTPEKTRAHVCGAMDTGCATDHGRSDEISRKAHDACINLNMQLSYFMHAKPHKDLSNHNLPSHSFWLGDFIATGVVLFILPLAQNQPGSLFFQGGNLCFLFFGGFPPKTGPVNPKGSLLLTRSLNNWGLYRAFPIRKFTGSLVYSRVANFGCVLAIVLPVDPGNPYSRKLGIFLL